VRKNYDDEMFAEPDPSSANTSPEFENEVYEHRKRKRSKAGRFTLSAGSQEISISEH
jgi:hypothetical protein